MKLKSKYNIGNLVEYWNTTISDYDIGIIKFIQIRFSSEMLQETIYKIYPIIQKDVRVDYGKEIKESNVKRKLNKKTFDKVYTREYAKLLARKENK